MVEESEKVGGVFGQLAHPPFASPTHDITQHQRDIVHEDCGWSNPGSPGLRRPLRAAYGKEGCGLDGGRV